MKSVIDNIGNTPLVHLQNAFQNRKIFLKLEGQNPGGSLKDRVAKFLIERALERGYLKPGIRILEATSGNMGIALAMVGAAKGIGVTIVMSEGMSVERQQMIRAFGAELILTDRADGTIGARRKVSQLLEQYPDTFWFANQFDNTDNPLAHETGLAVEILKQMPEVQTIVVGVGTSGTAVGLARFFKKNAPHVRVIGVLPPPGFGVQGLQHPDGDFRPQIWTPKDLKTVLISQKSSFSAAREIAKREGLMLGQSSGAVLAAIAQGNFEEPIIGISADRGEKYLSTALFP